MIPTSIIMFAAGSGYIIGAISLWFILKHVGLISED